MDLGDDFRCNFGTRSTKAYFVSSTFLWCRSAVSDVVDKAMPFSISLNRQQNSKSDIEYWYYNDPNLQKLNPDFGPLAGGSEIIMTGNNFKPFDYVKEIDNSNDTFCNFGPLGKKPAIVKSSTYATCISPKNTFNPPLVSVQMSLTINNQNTSNELEFIFFNPPGLSEVTPLRGPTTGGTEVHIYGTKFNHARDPVCIFGGITVNATFFGPTHISCVSPPTQNPGQVLLTIKYRKDRFHAGNKFFTYFQVPTVLSIEPNCGPIRGYTQIYITGNNFLENDNFGKAICSFNGSYNTNATVIDENSLWCDSPQLDLGDSDTGDYFYNLSISADGESYSVANVTFLYYDDPDIRQINPPNGPYNEANQVSVSGKSLNHPNMCNKKIKFGQQILEVQSATDTDVVVTTVPVAIPGSVVVTMSGNGQQYSDDITLHFRDRPNTFEFFQPFLVEDLMPTQAKGTGHTDIHLTGMLFDQFKNGNGTTKDTDYKCRFRGKDNNQIVIEERNMTKVSDIEYICPTSPTNYSGDTVIEISQNDENWQDIGKNLVLASGFRATSCSPTYGVTKNPDGKMVSIYGESFECGDCKHLKARFTTKNGDKIVVNAIRISDSEIQA